MKHADHEKMAIQKFWAMAEGNWCRCAIHPPLFSATVSASVLAPATSPVNSPQNAPFAVERFQNMPSKKVANSGAFTNAKTSCKKSMMLLKYVARYAQAIESATPATVVTRPTQR